MMSMHEASSGKFGLLSNQGISGSISLEAQNTGSSHIHIPKRKLLLSCLRKDDLALQSKTGNQLSSPDDMGCTDLSSSCFTEIHVLYT